MNRFENFAVIAKDLEQVGLIWKPEVGDEVSIREDLNKVSILVDPAALPYSQLKEIYLWLPNTEQLVAQLEARQAVLFHAGLDLSSNHFSYRAVVQVRSLSFEVEAPSLRLALGLSLRDLLIASNSNIH